MTGRRITTAERLTAAPAIAVLALCAVGSVVLGLHGEGADPQRLRAQADADFASDRFDAAALRYQYLMALTPDAPEPVYRLALTLDKRDRRAEAMRVLALIAPTTGGGYLPAHMRLAEWLIEARMLGQSTDANVIAAARAHLRQPFTDEADRKRAAELLRVLDVDQSPATRP